MMNRKEIIQKMAPIVATVFVAALGADVKVRRLTLSERLEIEGEFAQQVGDEKVSPAQYVKLQAMIASRAWVDEKNKPMFTDEELLNFSGDAPSVISTVFYAATGVDTEPKKSDTDGSSSD